MEGVKEKTISGWIEENASPFLAQIQIFKRESQPHSPMEKLLNFSFIGRLIIFGVLLLSWANGSTIHGLKFEEKKGDRFFQSNH